MSGRQPKGLCPKCGRKGLGNVYSAPDFGAYRQCLYCSEMVKQGAPVAGQHDDNTRPEIRTKGMNPDFRPEPKTSHYCLICSRDLKPGQPRRVVMYELDRYCAIHPDDWERAKAEIPPTRAPYGADALLIHPIGMDCARRLGLEWSQQGDAPPAFVQESQS